MAHPWTRSEFKALHPNECSQGYYSIFTKRLWDVWDHCLALKCSFKFVDRKKQLKKGKNFTVISKTTGGVNITKKYWLLLPHSYPRALSLRPHTILLHLYLVKFLRHLSIYHICFSLSLNDYIADSPWNQRKHKLYYKAGPGFVIREHDNKFHLFTEDTSWSTGYENSIYLHKSYILTKINSDHVLNS